jgi:formyltetrahydrofolate synthetase
LQTLEGDPVFVHTGPFGNIAHGNSSVLADQIGLKLAPFVVTEAGFGSDLGFEKMVDIKCRHSGLRVDAAVVVCTVRALKMHSGRFRIVPGRPLPEDMLKEDVGAVEAGIGNLEKHIENVTRQVGIPAVVALNRFGTDAESELDFIRERAIAAGARACEISQVWEHGGDGGAALAHAVAEAAGAGGNFQFVYPLDAPIKDKIEAIVTSMYGGDGVDFSPEALRQIDRYTRWGLGDLPVCMAKTHLSLSANQNDRGRPRGFRVPVREVKPSAGAGFLVVYLGEVRTIPGLPSEPAAVRVDIDERGRVVGLF